MWQGVYTNQWDRVLEQELTTSMNVPTLCGVLWYYEVFIYIYIMMW